MALRARSEPICLFGEDAFARRQRLSLLIAKDGATSTKMDLDDTEKAVAKEFYSVGSDDLRSFREMILPHSLQLASVRLHKERVRIESCENPKAVSEAQTEFEASLAQHMTIAVSQVGDKRPLTVARFSPDGTTLATGSWTGDIKFWSLPSCNEPVKVLKGKHHGGLRVHDLQFSPGEGPAWLASAGGDGRINLWSKDGSVVGQLGGHDLRTNRIKYLNTPTPGSHLVSTSHDLTVRVWDVERQTCLIEQEGHSRPVFALAVHADGALVATGDTGGVGLLWDLRTSKAVMALRGHAGAVYGCDFNPVRSHELATGSGDHTVRIWDLRRQAATYTLMQHRGLVSEVKYEPGLGRTLVSSSFDCTVKLWKAGCDLANPGQFGCAATLRGAGARIMGMDVAASAEGGVVIAGVSYDRTFRLWARDDHPAFQSGGWNDATIKEKENKVEWPTAPAGGDCLMGDEEDEEEEANNLDDLL